MTDGSSNIALFGLIGALAGTIPGLLGVFFGWLKSRDSLTRTQKSIEVAKAEVDFISEWVKAAESTSEGEELSTRKQLARDRLDALLKVTEEDAERISKSTREIKTSEVSSKKSLAFYIYSGFFFFLLLGSAVDENDDFSISYFMSEMMSEDGAITVAAFGIPWIIWFIHRWRVKNKRRSVAVHVEADPAKN